MVFDMLTGEAMGNGLCRASGWVVSCSWKGVLGRRDMKGGGGGRDWASWLSLGMEGRV